MRDRKILYAIIGIAVVALAIGIGGAFFSAEAPAWSTAEIRHDYYAVKGATLDELRADAAKIGPKDAKGALLWASTGWNVKWTLAVKQWGGRCRIESVDTRIDVLARMPRWRGRDEAKPDLARRWDRFLSAIDGQQRVQAGFALKAAGEIRRLVTKYPPYKSCDTLERKARSEAESIVEKYRLKSEGYARSARLRLR